MDDSSFGHRHSDNVGSFRHLRIPQNIHLYAANLHKGNSTKYFTHYAIPQSINSRSTIRAVWYKMRNCAEEPPPRKQRKPVDIHRHSLYHSAFSPQGGHVNAVILYCECSNPFFASYVLHVNLWILPPMVPHAVCGNKNKKGASARSAILL